MNRYIEYLLSLPKSLYVNLRMLPFKDAIKLPMIVRYNTLLASLDGRVFVKGEANFGRVKIGFGHVGIFDKKYDRTILEVGGKVVFEGNATIGHGSRIVVGKNAELYIGDKFVNTAGISIICFKSIIFGKNVLTSWDTIVMDTDFHSVIDLNEGNKGVVEREVIIGNHIWIGCRVTMLKGTQLSDDIVVAAGSVINKKIDKSSVLIAGNPARIKKSGISWEF